MSRLAGGLAWLGVLLFGVVGEQVKTRLEDREAEQGTKVPLLHFCCHLFLVAAGLLQAELDSPIAVLRAT